MKDRIKRIRKHYELTQDGLGEKIGINRASVSLLESGRNTPSEQTLRLILSEFPVNEEWLRTGQGEMLNNDAEFFRSKLREKFNHEDDAFKNWLIDRIITMDENARAALEDFIREGAELCRSGNAPHASNREEAAALLRDAYQRGVSDGVELALKEAAAEDLAAASAPMGATDHDQ